MFALNKNENIIFSSA